MTPPLTSHAVRDTEVSLSGAGRAMTVERFEPDAEGPFPAVLLLHGADGLRYRGPVYRTTARHLAGRGLRVLVPHYFERTGTPGHASAARPLDFLGWMEAVTDTIGTAGPGPVGLVGFSLGAYLALAVAGRDERVAAVVDVCGGLPALIAGGFTRMPPVLILHGGADTVVPPREARTLESWLRERGTPCEVVIYPGEGHSLSEAAADDALRRTTAFLMKHLGVGSIR